MAGGNVFRVRTELWIEDVNVGSWTKLSYHVDKSRLAVECDITLPIYGIGTEDTADWTAADRVRQIYKDCSFRRGSLVKAYAWYEQPTEWGSTFEKVLVFKGFIAKPIKNGFPVVIKCENLAYIFRFGRLNKSNKQNMKFEEVIQEALPICKDAFMEFRKQQQLPETLSTEPDFMSLKWMEGGGNLQAVSTPVAYNPYNEVTPYNMLEQLMRSFNLYCTILDDWTVHFGARLLDNQKKTELLSTGTNVLDRDIKTDDGAFVDYFIRLTGISSGGNRIAVEYMTNNSFAATSNATVQSYIGSTGYQTRGNRSSINGVVSASAGRRPMASNGEWGTNKKKPLTAGTQVVERWASSVTEDGLKREAEGIAYSLRGLRHKGKLTLMLYPFLRIFDYVKYEDTQFPDLNGGYFITGYELTISATGGCRQVIEVTDEIWAQ